MGSTVTPGISREPNTVVELRERIHAAWKPFRDAVRQLGRARLGGSIDDGRTYKDMLAHVAAWMEYVPVRLDEIRGGRPDPITWSRMTIDDFNARAVAERRLVGAEAMLDELDTSYRGVLAQLDRTTDAEIAGSSHSSGILSLFAWCTYLHLEEHLHELGDAR